MSVAFPFDPQADELGTDIAVSTDLTPVWGIASGKLNLAYAILRRLSTPRGGLFYDLDYGFDVRSLLNAALTPAQLSAARGAIVGEAEKDPRVQSCVVTLTFDSQRNRLDLAIELDTAEGPFDLVIAATAVTVELLAVDGVPAPVTALPDAPVAQSVVVGGIGPPGPAGPPGAGVGVFERPVDDPNEMEVTSGAEEVVFEYVEDFDVLASGTLAARFTGYFQSLSGTSTWRMRIGGTSGAADGTVVATVTTASATFVALTGSGTFTNPTGRVPVKITAANAVAGQAARSKGAVATVR